MNESDFRLTQKYVATLIMTWLIGTALVLAASFQVSTLPVLPITTAYLDQLHDAWSWYAAAYGVLVVTDGTIALLGVMLCTWLRPASLLVSGMVIALFVLSGIFGLLGDVAMVAAAQVFRNGSAMFSPEFAGAFLGGINLSTNWVSAASIFPGGIAALLILAAARKAGVGLRWIRFTRMLGFYQILLGLGCVFALLSQNALALNLGVIGAAILLPALCIPWLLWTLREMKKTNTRDLQPIGIDGLDH
ncbi:MAG: hypothetical protein LRY56_04860 [Burkholderiaceae bacterium]|nr:hypothetical protein [Burkholderiaceae bacterium]MCD8516423.1 hypothetical protein [Burkholderiaceae bacterium]MCD8536854.1 hypothetical protein [Burkholderiaceae bacterium]